MLCLNELTPQRALGLASFIAEGKKENIDQSRSNADALRLICRGTVAKEADVGLMLKVKGTIRATPHVLLYSRGLGRA